MDDVRAFASIFVMMHEMEPKMVELHFTSSGILNI